MKKLLFVLLTIVFYTPSFSQPGTEIYLFDLKIKRDKITISNPRNITARQGYDNQPFFHTDKPLLYFVSANEEGRTDIFSYNLQTKVTQRITETSEREYSPTLTPDKAFLSCIVQRDSGAQDLAKYPVNGGTPKILINNQVIGYHAWAGPDQVAVFTLPRPFKLHLIDLSTGRDTVLAENIGRSIHKIPGKPALSFIHQIANDTYVIKKFNTSTLEISEITKSLPGREKDMAWTPDGTIIMSDENKIFFLKPGSGSAWKEIETTSPLPAGTLSRLAVNSDATVLAVVVSE
jgi:hypothetical protein